MSSKALVLVVDGVNVQETGRQDKKVNSFTKKHNDPYVRIEFYNLVTSIERPNEAGIVISERKNVREETDGKKRK